MAGATGLTPFPGSNVSGLTPFPGSALPSEQETPYSELSSFDLLKAGDIKGWFNRDIMGGIVEPFVTGAAQALNEQNRARQAEVEAYGNFAESIANSGFDPQTGQWGSPDPDAIAKANDASAYANEANKLVLQGPGMVSPLAPGVFLGDVANVGLEEGPAAAARAATYGPLADFVSQEGLGEKLSQQPVTTIGEGIMSAIPMGIAGRLGYKGAKAARESVRERYGEAMQALDDIEGSVSRIPRTTEGGSGIEAEGAERQDLTARLQGILQHAEGIKRQRERQEYAQWWEDTLQQQDADRIMGRMLGADESGNFRAAGEPELARMTPAAYASPQGGDRFVNIANEVAELIRQEIPDASPDLAKYIYGQMMHESGWGKDPAALESNNFAGLHGGARGRKYADDHEYARDYASFFTKGAHGAAARAGSPMEFARSLNGSGWFSDPNWEGYGRTIESALGDYESKVGRGQASGGAGALEQGTAAWEGQRMPHGENGCVEAVVRIGSWHDPWLAEEAQKGVTNVDVLVSDAGDRVIPFDESKLERGDVIVYGDEADPQRHVVIYDGKGGYIGNSSSQQRVVRGEDLYEMAPWKPTRIIKSAERQGEGQRGDVPGEPFAGRERLSDEPTMGNPEPLSDMFGRDKTGIQEGLQRDIDDALSGLDEWKDDGKLHGEPAWMSYADYAPETIDKQISQMEDRQKWAIQQGRPLDAYWLGEEIQRARGIKSDFERDARAQRAIQDLQAHLDLMQEEAQSILHETASVMERTFEGKGVDRGYTTDERGQINGRWAVSNNAQWRQDFFKEHGRLPNKGEINSYAYEQLMREPEFAELDRGIRRMEEYIDRLKKNPDADISDIMEQVDSEILYSIEPGKPGKATAGRAAPQSSATKAAPAPTRPRRMGEERAPVGESIPREEARESATDTMERDVSETVDRLAEESGLPSYGNTGQPANITGGVSGTRNYSLGQKQSKGSYSEETASRSDIFKRARELFGTLRIGRTGGKNVGGFYNQTANALRMKSMGQWGTMWHEIGHKLDFNMGLEQRLGDTEKAELLKLLSDDYGGQIPKEYYDIAAKGGYGGGKDVLVSEGIAHFMDKYMNNPAKVAKDLPNTLRTFEAALRENPDIASRVAEMRDMMRVYREQGDWAAVAGDISTKEPDGIRQKLEKAAERFMANWVDDKWDIRQMDKYVESVLGRKLSPEESAYWNARLAESNGVAHAKFLLEEADGERAARILGEKLGIALHPATFRMAIDKLREFEKEHGDFLKERHVTAEKALSTYMVARRFMEVHDYKTAETGKKYNMPQGYDTYKRIVESAPKELEEAAQILWDLNDNLLRIMRKGGMLSEKQYKALREKGERYCPLAREFPDDASMVEGMTGHNFINVGSPIKRLGDYGSMWDVKDPLQTIGGNVAKICNLVERNHVGQVFAGYAKRPGMGAVIEKVPGQKAARDSSFDVWIDGKQETYQTTPEIYAAMKTLRPEGMDSLMKYALALPARWLRAGATSTNLAFSVKNVFRDNLDAWLFSRYGYKPFIDLAKGVFHMAKRDDVWQQYKASGAIMSTIVNAEKNFHAEALKGIRRHGWRKAFHYLNPLARLEDVSNFFENATRVGLFNNALLKGASRMEAAIEAREGTLDFGRGGRISRAANKYIPFLNAGIQGAAIFTQRTLENPRAMAAKLGTMAIGSLALYALIRSNDELAKEYDEFMPYERDMFWHIPVPKEVSGTGWIRLPKPFEAGMLGATLPERLVDLAYGNGKPLKEWGKRFAHDYFWHFSLPPMVIAGEEWISGYSNFKERSIVPESEKHLRPEDQYGPRTSELAKSISKTELGRFLELSPRKVDNLGQNLFAGAYTQGMNVADAVFGGKDYENPLKQAVSVDPYGSPQSIQDYYDRKTKATEAYTSYKQKGTPIDMEDARDYKRVQAIDKGMQQFSKQLKAAQKRGDDDEYRRIKKQQTKFINEMLKHFDRR